MRNETCRGYPRNPRRQGQSDLPAMRGPCQPHCGSVWRCRIDTPRPIAIRKVAILIGWSPRSKRWERRGTLVEPRALVSAKAQCEADSEKRNVARQRASERRVIEDREYHAQFRAAVLQLYPGCPRAEATDIASHACEKHSGRVGPHRRCESPRGRSRSLGSHRARPASPHQLRHRNRRKP